MIRDPIAGIPPIPTPASKYFRGLSETFLQIQVTERSGAAVPLDDGAGQAVGMLRQVGQRGGKILVIGNGGSAAIADHVHNDLCKAAGIRSLVFTDVSLLTALSNDNGYVTVFRWSVDFWADRGDLLVAISSSGRSDSIVTAATAAAWRGCAVITLSGFDADNPLRSLGDLNFYVPASTYGYVEMTHSALAHFLTDACCVPANGISPA